jgi:hypothetical protein
VSFRFFHKFLLFAPKSGDDDNPTAPFMTARLSRDRVDRLDILIGAKEKDER